MENTNDRLTNVLIVGAFAVGLGALTPASAYIGGDVLPPIPLKWGVLICILIGAALGIVTSRIMRVKKSRYFKNMLIGIVYISSTYWAIIGFEMIHHIKYRFGYLVPLAAGLIPLLLILFIQAVIFNKIESAKSVG